MKPLFIKATLIFCVLGINVIHAQNASITSGGDATGAGGTVSYSIGQISYSVNTGTNYYEIQGVQQPHEISKVVGVETVHLEIDINFYPNPTGDVLHLEINDYTDRNYTYTIADLSGKSISRGKIESSTTLVNLEQFAMGTYLFSILENNTAINTFKILKK